MTQKKCKLVFDDQHTTFRINLMTKSNLCGSYRLHDILMICTRQSSVFFRFYKLITNIVIQCFVIENWKWIREIWLRFSRLIRCNSQTKDYDNFNRSHLEWWVLSQQFKCLCFSHSKQIWMTINLWSSNQLALLII